MWPFNKLKKLEERIKNLEMEKKIIVPVDNVLVNNRIKVIDVARVSIDREIERMSQFCKEGEEVQTSVRTSQPGMVTLQVAPVRWF